MTAHFVAALSERFNQLRHTDWLPARSMEHVEVYEHIKEI
jgi:hypothetical protein